VTRANSAAIEQLLDLPDFFGSCRGVFVEIKCRLKLLAGCRVGCPVRMLLKDVPDQLLQKSGTAILGLRLPPVLQRLFEEGFQVSLRPNSGEQDEDGGEFFFGGDRFAAAVSFKGAADESLHFVVFRRPASAVGLKRACEFVIVDLPDPAAEEFLLIGRSLSGQEWKQIFVAGLDPAWAGGLIEQAGGGLEQLLVTAS